MEQGGSKIAAAGGPLTADVVIVGAGPVGMMVARLLALDGVRTLVLERRHAPFTEPRAIAFDPETLRCFQRIDCLDALMPTLEVDVPVAYYNGAGRLLGRVASMEKRFGFSPRGTFYQPEFEAALSHGIESCGDIRLMRGVTVGDVADLGDHVTVALVDADGKLRRVRASYAVACDGGTSRVRERLGVGFYGSTFAEKWLVVDVVDDNYPHREIRFFCDPRRPAVTLPVSRGRRRWEFLLMPGDDEARFAEADNARALIRAISGTEPGAIERSLIYSFHARTAERFRAGRVFLAGDAAHLTPPFAGQGLNGGIRDAANLAWKLAAVCQGRMNETLLDSYDDERRGHVKAMTALAVRLGGAIMPTNRVRAWLRDAVMRTLGAIPAQRARVNRGDIIPAPDLGASRLVNWSAGGPVGQMIPQPDVRVGKDDVPLDVLLGPGFAVIGLGADPLDCLSSADVAVAARLKARLIHLGDGGDAVDLRGELATWSGMERGMLLVRPDRFLADRMCVDDRTDKLAWAERAYTVMPAAASPAESIAA